jgi:hypothetical protein
VRSFYWDDPLNQAVMVAWREGLAVVVSAGNAGPVMPGSDSPLATALNAR